MKKLNLCLIIENTTDIRLINGLRDHFKLTVIGRKRKNYSIVPWKIPNDVGILLIRCRKVLYPLFLFFTLIKKYYLFDFLMVNSNTFAGLSLTILKLIYNKPCISLICKPTIEYLRAKFIKRKIGICSYIFTYIACRILIMWTVYHFDLNIALSEYIKRKLSGYSKKEIEVIPIYGIDNQIFECIANKRIANLRKELKLPLGKYIIFISSRISPEKDISTVLYSLKMLIEKGINNIVILNLSGQYKEFSKMAKGLSLDKYIIGYPAVNPYSLVYYYNAVDLCIQPSINEGLGFSPLESLACKTPTIVAHTGGMIESTLHNMHTIHYIPEDPLDLANKILYAYKNPGKMKKMTNQGFDWVIKKYNATRLFVKLKLCLENLRVKNC